MPTDEVHDDENLYRRVPLLDMYFKDERDANGHRKLNSQAFGDRQMKISVDRAKLRNNVPALSRDSPTDAVACLLTVKVREIKDVPHPDNAGLTRDIDVKPDPIGEHFSIETRNELPENPAHALIRATPEFRRKNDSHFKKLKSALVKIYTWELPPEY